MKEHDTVYLRTTGTIVHIYADALTCEVEFANAEGVSEVVTLPLNQLISTDLADKTARQLNSAEPIMQSVADGNGDEEHVRDAAAQWLEDYRSKQEDNA